MATMLLVRHLKAFDIPNERSSLVSAEKTVCAEPGEAWAVF
jgi:hypothetical protein